MEVSLNPIKHPEVFSDSLCISKIRTLRSRIRNDLLKVIELLRGRAGARNEGSWLPEQYVFLFILHIKWKKSV